MDFFCLWNRAIWPFIMSSLHVLLLSRCIVTKDLVTCPAVFGWFFCRDAFSHVQERRFCINPNVGFVHQLQVGSCVSSRELIIFQTALITEITWGMSCMVFNFTNVSDGCLLKILSEWFVMQRSISWWCVFQEYEAIYSAKLTIKMMSPIQLGRSFSLHAGMPGQCVQLAFRWQFQEPGLIVSLWVHLRWLTNCLERSPLQLEVLMYQHFLWFSNSKAHFNMAVSS